MGKQGLKSASRTAAQTVSPSSQTSQPPAPVPQPVETPYSVKSETYRKVDAIRRWEQRSAAASFVISGRPGDGMKRR